MVTDQERGIGEKDEYRRWVVSTIRSQIIKQSAADYGMLVEDALLTGMPVWLVERNLKMKLDDELRPSSKKSDGWELTEHSVYEQTGIRVDMQTIYDQKLRVHS